MYLLFSFFFVIIYFVRDNVGIMIKNLTQEKVIFMKKSIGKRTNFPDLLRVKTDGFSSRKRLRISLTGVMRKFL